MASLNRKRKTALLDASSAILLSKAGLHEEVAALYFLVLTKSVYQEIVVSPKEGSTAYRDLFSRGEIEVVTKKPSIPEREGFGELTSLGPGERDSLLLFLTGVGDFFITDDGAAARFCKRRKIPFINALLVPRIMDMSGLADPDFCEQAFQMIEKNGRYSSHIISIAKNLSGNDLKNFMPSLPPSI